MLVTFNIRRIKNLPLRHWKHSCANISHLLFPETRRPLSRVWGGCCHRCCSRRLLLLPLQRSPRRNATRVFQRVWSPRACALLSRRPVHCRRADPCCWEPGRVPAARALSLWPWVRAGNVQHVPLLLQKPLQFTRAQLEG